MTDHDRTDDGPDVKGYADSELAQRARELGIDGYEDMDKDELTQAVAEAEG